MQNSNTATIHEHVLIPSRLMVKNESNRSRAERKTATRAERVYYIKQRLLGLAMALIGVIIPFINDGDATASLAIVPLGLWLVGTKGKILIRGREEE